MTKTLLLLFCCMFSVLLHAQITQINSNRSLHIRFALDANKGILVSDVDSSVWVSDGTPAGTIQLSSNIFWRADGGLLNGKFFFAATSPATGIELYATDGTIAGTAIVKDIFPGTAGSVPYQNFALLNGYLYFTASTPGEGREVWRTDGTAANTTLVKDIMPGTGSSNTGAGYNLFSNGAYLLFGAAATTGDIELWRSDGTSLGTTLVKDINTFAGKGSKPDYFNKYGSMVLFMANDSTHGNEIWKTDGTDAGTTLLKDIYTGLNSSVTYAFFKEINNKLLFVADNGAAGAEIWSTDGTTANTNLVKDIFPGNTGSYATTYNSVVMGNKLVFTAADPLNGYELWQTDGTPGGTTLLKDIATGFDNSTPYLMLAYEINYGNGTFTNPLYQGNKIFFQATTVANGAELWVTDGTAAGTTLVKDINSGVNSGFASISFFYTTADLYFSADDGVYGNELWKTNGTLAGTSRISDINTGLPSADIQLGMVVGSKLVFQATNGDAIAKDLYRLDAAVTVLPIPLSDFTVSVSKANAVLEWNTSCEVNSKSFTIQRSLTGQDFVSIGQVNASGNSCDKRTYNYTDAGILSKATGKIYYRLLMTDKDGKTSYSKIISVKANGAADWNIKLLQNPVVNEANLLLTDVSDKVTLYLKDMKGNTLPVNKVLTASGQTTINVSTFAPGIYTLIAESANERKTVRFVKL